MSSVKLLPVKSVSGIVGNVGEGGRMVEQNRIEFISDSAVSMYLMKKINAYCLYAFITHNATCSVSDITGGIFFRL